MALREHYTAELEQVRLQVELMAVRVSEHLDWMRSMLLASAPAIPGRSVEIDADIDAMNVSLTERCYEIIVREAPVAADARFVLSVIRLLNEFEQISDLAVGVCGRLDAGELADIDPHLLDLLLTMTDEVCERFNAARRVLGALDLYLAEDLAEGSRIAEALSARLIREVVDLSGPDAVAKALTVVGIGSTLDRMNSHTTVVGARLRYLITGDPTHLAAEVR